MHIVSHIFLASLLASPAAAQQQPTTAPCVPEGGRVSPGFDRPPLGQPGDPVGAEWVHSPGTADGSGDPQLREKDSFSGDDPMGAATPSSDGSAASAPVDNHDGDLSGPNGEDQNGGSEGPCIEVYVEWTYRYPVTIHKSITSSLWGLSSGETEIVVVWKYAKKRAKVKEICPC